MSSPTKLTCLAGFKFANSTKICPNPDVFREPWSLKSRLSNFSPEYNPNLHCTRGQTLCYKTHRCHTSRSAVGIIFRQVNLQLYILEYFKDRTLFDIEHRLLVLCHDGWSGPTITRCERQSHVQPASTGWLKSITWTQKKHQNEDYTKEKRNMGKWGKERKKKRNGQLTDWTSCVQDRVLAVKVIFLTWHWHTKL